MCIKRHGRPLGHPCLRRYQERRGLRLRLSCSAPTAAVSPRPAPSRRYAPRHSGFARRCAAGSAFLSAIAVCYATSPVVGDCRLISAPLWSCGLNRRYRVVPSSLGLARLVSLAGVFIGRVRPCAPLRSRVSRGVPRPARTSGVGSPAPSPFVPPLPAVAPYGLGLRPRGER